MPTTDTTGAEMMLREAVRNRFYGSLEFKYEAGIIVLVRKTETIKPQSERTSRSEEGRAMTGGTHNAGQW